VVDTGHDQAEHVELTLDQNGRFLPANGLLGVMEIVEHRALVKDPGLRRVEVLGLAGPDNPPTESHDAAAQVIDREQQPAAEAREDGAIVSLEQETGLQQHALFDAELLHGIGEGLAAGRIAQAVLTRHLGRNLALGQILPSGIGLGVFPQPGGKPLLGDRGGGK
jgi:hypothetical protein